MALAPFDRRAGWGQIAWYENGVERVVTCTEDGLIDAVHGPQTPFDANRSDEEAVQLQYDLALHRVLTTLSGGRCTAWDVDLSWQVEAVARSPEEAVRRRESRLGKMQAYVDDQLDHAKAVLEAFESCPVDPHELGGRSA